MKAAVIVVVGIGIAPYSASAQVRDQPLRCAASGYTATYSPEAKGTPPMVDVTFRGAKPTSAVAEATLRKCLKEAADTMFIRSEVLATAWYGRTKDDDAPLSLADGSDHLAYDPKTKQIITWNQRQGVKPAVSQGTGFFVEYQEDKILVSPGGRCSKQHRRCF